MTVCIAAICEDKRFVVVASDRMLTTSYPPIKFDHTESKIFPVNSNCLALFAGEGLKAPELILKIRASLVTNPSVKGVINTTKELYQSSRIEEAEEFLLRPRNIDKDDFYRRGINIYPPDLFNQIDRQFLGHDYGLELLIAGCDDSGAHIYSVRNPGVSDCFDLLGFTAIGVGYLHAMQVFIAHSYKNSFNTVEALNIVFAAKKAAEVAPGVGHKTDVALISENGFEFLDSTTLDELCRIYDETKPSPVEEIKKKSDRLIQLLQKRSQITESAEEEKKLE